MLGLEIMQKSLILLEFGLEEFHKHLFGLIDGPEEVILKLFKGNKLHAPRAARCCVGKVILIVVIVICNDLRKLCSAFT